MNSHCADVCIFLINICNFSNFVTLCTNRKDTPVSCDKRFRDFWVFFSNLSLFSFSVSSNMSSTVDFSILYGASFFESFSLSPNCLGIRHRSSWKFYSKFASCFRTRLSAFHIVL